LHLTRLTIYQSPIPLTEPFVISLGPLTHANNLLVRAETDTGLVGWGEASPFPTIHGETMEGGFEVARLMDSAIVGNTCVKSAFDMACYDLAARAAKKPLYAYLGGENDKSLYTDYTVSLGPIELMVKKALWIKDQGFPVVKIKLGEGPQDAERVDQISKAIGPQTPLRLDANQGWTPDLAISLLQGMAGYNIQHCEAPVPRRDFLHLPNEDARRLLDLEAIDGINIKLSKSGGLYKAMKILRIAEAEDIPVQIGGFLESRLGFTAAAHLALCSAQAVYYDFDTPLMQHQDYVAGGIVYGDNGSVAVPDAIGLGAEMSEEYLAKLIRVQVY